MKLVDRIKISCRVLLGLSTPKELKLEKTNNYLVAVNVHLKKEIRVLKKMYANLKREVSE